MYDPQTDAYKFTLVYFHQQHDGYPVYDADLRLLIRNERGYPLVLAASSLHTLDDFALDPTATTSVNEGAAFAAAAAEIDSHADADTPPLALFSTTESVIWAGTPGASATPHFAITFVGESDPVAGGKMQKWRFVADAQTGEILHRENLILFETVTGRVSGMATTGAKADFCNPEVDTPMPYARVTASGGGTVYADAFGDYEVEIGSSPTSISSYMSGLYFTVDNYTGSEETLTATGDPGGVLDFVHNEANNSAAVRAQVNGYVQANRVRAMILAANPSYPTISTDTNFPVRVNRTDGYCPGNAWYDGSSINFCSAGSSYPNTAWQSVLFHEYGHHAVASGGSGQGQYGEGMSDTVAMLDVDDPILGYGFFGTCDDGLRTADNDYQYPCNGTIHDCGQLLSGSFWSTRNAMSFGMSPGEYLPLLRSLAINSILLHNGDMITPQITIDVLTLDDDDANIGNGTPHYNDICTGFNAHNMDCPELETGLSISPAVAYEAEGPTGGPFTPETKVYTLQNLSDYPINYSVTVDVVWLDVIDGTGSIPAMGQTTCTLAINGIAGSLASGRYNTTIAFRNLTDGIGDIDLNASLRVGTPIVVYAWDMETNPGWSTEGQWGFGQPSGSGGAYGNPDPSSGYTGTNVYGYNLNGDYTNNMPEYDLTTDAIDCTDLSDVHLKFRRYLGVEQSAYDHAYVRVSNNGTNWVTVWQNDETITDSSWVPMDLDISSVADDQSTVYVRWTMGTTDVGWTYCGWNIDDVEIEALGGEPPALTMVLPDGLPGHVEPGVSTPLTVEVIDGAETFDPSTGRLFYRFDDGAFGEVPLDTRQRRRLRGPASGRDL
jgi:hypothetical protein